MRRYLHRKRWTGPACYCSDYSLVPRPGFYALRPDGKRFVWPRLRLVFVDDAPGNHLDGSGHYEIAKRRDPVAKAGRVVALEAHALGTSETNGQPS